MEYLIGVVLALATVVFARVVGLDRDRAFYPTVLIVVASYYILFAAMGADGRTLAKESVIFLGFAAVAVVGFKSDLRYVAAALVGHGVFDFIHRHQIANPGVPKWWPGFCLAFDVVMGAWMFIGVPWRRRRFE